jgi:hypothetical protein
VFADVTHAPLVIPALLAACLAVMAGFAFIAVAAAAGRRLARAGLIGLASLTGLYACTLLAASAFSKEYVLGRGVEKRFCEPDCHLAYAVTAVERRGDTHGGDAAYALR